MARHLLGHQYDEALRFIRNQGPNRSRRRLIIFTRYPEPGRTKTRLIPALGPEGAAALQEQMTEHTLRTARQMQAERSFSLQVLYDGGSRQAMARWLGADLTFTPQVRTDLGGRLEAAFHESFREGMKRVVVMGTDCPGIRCTHLRAAFRALAGGDVVVGPARDGGYYLIGLRRPVPELFAGIRWGTEGVLQKTLAIASGLGLKVALLEPLEDVDRPGDLGVWEREARRANLAGHAPTISVVIPVLNEADRIWSSLRATDGTRFVTERIVVDGGSTDTSVQLAAASGARVITTPPGRAGQMNRGARVARGDVLLFLHADTNLPPGFEHLVLEALRRPGAIAGAFRLRIDGAHRGYRAIEWLANLRSACLGMPYGDQAIFLSADRFREAGGFPEIRIMEDFALMRRLRRKGRIAISHASATTSARRYETIGFWRGTWINQVMILGYLAGIPPDRLARWYRQGSLLHRGGPPGGTEGKTGHY